ncbi:MAG: ERF family protein [Candidatus Moeniiplasma glomeromycotorum]|nr:ERF family protein [Candidatus Moeniiplasma glomeromycotorum]MCE8167873.1 ERF family protein [Candidatus Moeniiplasma glomeromycotorum]
MINIYTKLKNIQSKSTEILKDNLNKFQNYKYFTEYQALTFLKPLLSEQGLTLHFEDLNATEGWLTKVEQIEKNWVVQYWKQATLINSDKPEEKIISKFLALGSNQDIAKAKGSAETYAIKYFLTKFFLIPISDNLDPDKQQWTSKQELTETEKKKVEEVLKKHNF